MIEPFSSAFLAHDANNDPCTQQGFDLEDGRLVDVSALLAEAKKKTNGASGELVLKFEGASNQPVSFQF